MAKATKDSDPYKLTISRRTIDKLGVKLYDRVALVISELVSNAYDADAPSVTVEVPAGQFLAERKASGPVDKGYTIKVTDTGIGMTPLQLNNYYLVVGADRRLDKRGAKSPGGRPVMGRKGVGKLAPFGICHKIEIISSGKDDTEEAPADKPYRTSHIILDYNKLNSDEEVEYLPETGKYDRTFTDQHGTTIILSGFLTRKVPAIDDLAPQIAQRFGALLGEGGFEVRLVDNLLPSAKPVIVQALDLPGMPGTRIEFNGPLPTLVGNDAADYSAELQSGEPTALTSGFWLDGVFYPIQGWVGYSKAPVKAEIAAGIRIYCRKKFAAQTLSFDTPSGFTGELQVRSYLIGELHCDWLDEGEDLIHTDRSNIQWSSDVGQELRTWGQKVVREIGKMARRPAAETTLDIFRRTIDLDGELRRRFPSRHQDSMRRRARDMAETLARKLHPVDAEDPVAAMEIITLVSAFAPHMELSDELSKAAQDERGMSLGTVATILQSAKLAESMTLGSIVDKRLRIIEQFRALVHAVPATNELQLQALLEQAPWLIRPEWTPISENRSLANVRDRLQRFLSDRLGQEVTLSTMLHPTKRPDFVLIGAEGPLRIVEIKKPQHAFDKDDFGRLYNYVTAFNAFFADPGHQATLKGVDGYEITLVADKVDLPEMLAGSFNDLKTKELLRPVPWDHLIDHTKAVHEEFMTGLSDAGLTPPPGTGA